MRRLLTSNHDNGAVEAGRWLQSLRLLHPNREQLDPSVLVVLGEVFTRHLYCGHSNDLLLASSLVHLGQSVEYSKSSGHQSIPGVLLALEGLHAICKDVRHHDGHTDDSDDSCLRPSLVLRHTRHALKRHRGSSRRALVLAELFPWAHDRPSSQPHRHVVLR